MDVIDAGEIAGRRVCDRHDVAIDRRTARRLRDRELGGVVHGHRGGRRADVARRITRTRRQRVRAIRRRARVPGCRVRAARDLGAERRPVEQELHARHAVFIGGGRRHGNRVGDRLAGSRYRQRNHGRCTVGQHGLERHRGGPGARQWGMIRAHEHGRQHVCTLGDAGELEHAVNRRVLELRARVEAEMDVIDAGEIAGRRVCDRHDVAIDRRTARRLRDRELGGVIHGHRGSRRADVARRVTRARRQRVRRVGRRARIPGRGVRAGRDLGTERRPVEQELHARHAVFIGGGRRHGNRVGDRLAGSRYRQRNHGRCTVGQHGLERHRGGPGARQWGMIRAHEHGRQHVCTLGDAGELEHAVNRRVLELRARVEAEMDVIDAGEIAGGRVCDRHDVAIHRRTARRLRDGQLRRVVDRDRGGGCPDVARGITRARRQCVRGVGRRARVPGCGVGAGRDLGPERRPVEQELHARHTRSVGGGCGHSRRVGDGGAARRARDRDRRRRRIDDRRNRRRHVRLDFRRRERAPVQAHLVDAPGKELAGQHVGADAQGARRLGHGAGARLPGCQRAIDVQPQRGPVEHRRQVAPGDERQVVECPDLCRDGGRDLRRHPDVAAFREQRKGSAGAILFLHDGAARVLQAIAVRSGIDPCLDRHRGRRIEAVAGEHVGEVVDAVEGQSGPEAAGRPGRAHNGPRVAVA